MATRDKTPVGPTNVSLLSGHVTRAGYNVHQAVWNPTGQQIASVGNDGTLRYVMQCAVNSTILSHFNHTLPLYSIWDANRSVQKHRVLNAHDGEPVIHVAWGVTDERIVTAGRDRTVRVWNAGTKRRGGARCSVAHT